MRIVKKGILILLALSVLFWCVSIVKCEWLTHAHGSEFAEGYKQTQMIDDIEYFKVLKYEEDRAEVYYISSGRTDANVVRFQKIDGSWTEYWWGTVWSARGSASDVIWPYFWHYFYYVLI